MKPILYPADETGFDSNGIGILSDAIDCTVIENLNVKFELEMRYPVTGIHFNSIRKRTIILAKPDPVTDPQPFRVYRITKPMGGQVMVYARHLVYDLTGITMTPFSSKNVVAAMQALKTNAVTDCPFSFSTDMDTARDMAVEIPTAIWTIMGSAKGSILDVYGGEYQFDGYSVKLLGMRGADRGVSIRYGKNLTSLEQDENCADCYTAVHPYWKKQGERLVQLPEKIVQAQGNHSYTHVMPLDCTQEFDSAPTEEQLRDYTTQYIKDNNLGVPKTSWKVEFVQLEQSEEYKGKALLERVLLGDTVSVDYAELDVSATARVNEVRYKPILERYESVTLGDVKANLADTIANQQKQLKSTSTQTQMQQAIQALTAAIIGAKGGSVRLLDDDGDGQPDTLYIADNPDPEQAIKVWRFNYEGWGSSKNGYNGPFIMGASFDSGFLADFITAGTLNAALVEVINLNADNISTGTLDAKDVKIINLVASAITSGILKSADGKSWFNLDSGVFHCEGENSTVEVNGGKIELFSKVGTKLIELIPHETAGGQLNVYDQTGMITYGVFAYNQETYLTCMNLDGNGVMSAKVGFRKLSDGNRVLAVGSIS